MDLSEDGSIVLGWLTRVAVLLGVLGVVVFDVLSLAVTRLSVTDDAKAAAIAGVHSYQETANPQTAYQAAVTAVQVLNPADQIPPGSFHVQPDGRVRLVVQREATTVVSRHLPALKDRLVMRAEAEAAP